MVFGTHSLMHPLILSPNMSASSVSQVLTQLGLQVHRPSLCLCPVKSSPSVPFNKSLWCYDVKGAGVKGGRGERLEKTPQRKQRPGKAGKGNLAEGIACAKARRHGHAEHVGVGHGVSDMLRRTTCLSKTCYSPCPLGCYSFLYRRQR